MTLFHFFNCAILTFGPHFVYYSATPLSEYDTIGTSIKAAIVYLVAALVKLVCLATFLKVSDNESFDPYQELLKASIGFIDVAGLYFAFTQLTHRNISQNHKFQAIGLDSQQNSSSHRLLPLLSSTLPRLPAGTLQQTAVGSSHARSTTGPQQQPCQQHLSMYSSLQQQDSMKTRQHSSSRPQQLSNSTLARQNSSRTPTELNNSGRIP